MNNTYIVFASNEKKLKNKILLIGHSKSSFYGFEDFNIDNKDFYYIHVIKIKEFNLFIPSKTEFGTRLIKM